jgi:uncharacterized phage-associated protein/predicted nucleotidyltransferase
MLVFFAILIYTDKRWGVFMADVFDVANYILKISREESEDDEYELISHMKLQKLVYFCQGFSLAFLDKPLFTEPIEAWEHGPVCPKLYHLLKGYGASPVTSVVDQEKIALDENEKLLVKMVYDAYGQYSAAKLRKITHEEGPWKETKFSSPISLKTMTDYFDSLVLVNPNAALPSSGEKKEEMIKILEEAEANGEIDPSQFCISVGKRSAPVRFDNKIPSVRKLILESVDNAIINKIYLFGSYAYGNPNEDSDIDLCVVVNDDTNKLDAYMKIIDNLTDNNIIPCDLLVYNAKVFFNVENPKSIENTIIKEGKVLYG